MYNPVVNDNDGYATLDFNSSVVLSDAMLIEKLRCIDIMSDREIYYLANNYYETILNCIFGPSTPDTMEYKSFYVDLFTNPKFIIALTQVMYNISPNHSVRRRVNKMCYDYLVLDENMISSEDEYIKGLLMTLSKTVNRDKLPKLCALPLPEDLASLICLSRYSSEKEIINVKRLNKVLMKQSISNISEQKIVDIYLALFDHVLPLFEGVMLDVVSPSQMNTTSAEVYGLITLAILDIFNELPLVDIKKGLMTFDNDRSILYHDDPIRINLEAISDIDYPRILRAIDILKGEGNYIRTT